MTPVRREDGEDREPLKAASEAAVPGVSKDLVLRLVESILDEPRTRHLGDTRLPDRQAVGELVELVRQIVFPGFFGRRGLTRHNLALNVEELLSRILLHAQEQIRSVLRYAQGLDPHLVEGADPEACDAHAREQGAALVEFLPELRRMLALDVQAAYDGDPAATHTDETIFCYPGIDAIFSHRLAHFLYRLGVPLLPRIIQEAAHSRTGIDIHPGATIGESFFIDHGGGVVIGETTRIGSHVRIYQGVTLGALSFERDDEGRMLHGPKKRHPTIGDRVVIYAGAVILGGETTIEDDAVISGGVFVTQSVPAGHVVRQKKPELMMRSHRDSSGGLPLNGGGNGGESGSDDADMKG